MDLYSIAIFAGVNLLSAKFIVDFFTYGLQLQGIENKEIWNNASFPTCVKHIEDNITWRLVVRCFYVDRTKVERLGWIFVVILISFWAVLLTIKNLSDRLKAILLFQEVSLLDVAEPIIFSFAFVWLLCLIYQWKKWGSHIKNVAQ